MLKSALLRSVFFRTAAAITATTSVWAGSTGAVAAADAPAKPNVLVIVADDLGYGDLGFQGGKEIPTPNLDKLAAGGVKCTSGYVTCPVCSPTRAGLLTGRYQQRFGHEFNPGPTPDPSDKIGLSLGEKTIADRFRAAGYKTGLVGKWHLGNLPEFHPQQRGFDEFYGFLGGAHPYFPGSPDNNPILRGTETVKDPEYLTDTFGQEAVAYIDRHKADPFYLQVTFNAVHNPQHAKPEHLERFKGISNERRRTYAGMLTAMDDAIGAILGKLESEKLEQNTLVVFISDNGGPEANGSTNGPLRGQKGTTWEGGVRIPFVVKWPAALPAGGEFHQPVIQLDVVPTALAAIGQPVSEKNLDGVNLLPFLKGEAQGAPHERLYWRFGLQSAIRQGDWKLVTAVGSEAPQLFNLKSDLGEKTDLASAEPEKFKELQAAWNEWNGTLVAPKWRAARANPNRQPGAAPRNRKKAAPAEAPAT